jgi:REP element-mobilizing transposase RayT
MRYNPEIHHRRSIRLKGYDYSQNSAYFVTICAQNRECLFGHIENGEMRLGEYGEIVKNCWDDLPNHYANVELGNFVVMPNHLHCIIILQTAANVGDAANVGAGLKPAPTIGQTHGLSEIVRALKTFSARKINKIRNVPGVPVWQRNYHEHIIRNEIEFHNITQYIINNPINWNNDEENR